MRVYECKNERKAVPIYVRETDTFYKELAEVLENEKSGSIITFKVLDIEPEEFAELRKESFYQPMY